MTAGSDFNRMSNAARKARKRAGIKFIREPKVGTPVGLRIENQLYLHPKRGLKLTAAARRRLRAREVRVDGS